MKLNGLVLYGSIAILLILLSWNSVHDNVCCVVEKAGLERVNGYYVAVGGVYHRRGFKLSFLPDFYEIFKSHRYLGDDRADAVFLTFQQKAWVLFGHLGKKIFYKVYPEHPAQYIFNPPATGWSLAEFGIEPAPIILHQVGSLADAPSLPQRADSNIAQLLQMPVTALLIILLTYIAYYLWSKRIEHSKVSISYDFIVQDREYWRSFTSSLSHFDILHLIFNVFALYELGSLEMVWGSPLFLCLNICLILITSALHIMLIFVCIKYGYSSMASSESIGFSCVLFAWMVAQSVRMNRFCPVFFMPSLCFTTYAIHLPMFSSYIPLSVNFGPFVLLVVTKFIIPRSSLLGHLSGIIIGYPLAWGMLDWLDPPLVTCILIAAAIYNQKLYVWKISNYDLYPTLSDFVVPTSLAPYYALIRIKWIYCALSPILLFLYGPLDAVTRIFFVFMVHSAVHARRCEWMTELLSVQQQCASLVLLALAMAAFLSLWDLVTVTGTLAAWTFLSASSGLSDTMLYSGLAFTSLAFLLEVCAGLYLITMLQTMAAADAWTKLLRVDRAALDQDLRQLGVVLPTRSFSGRGHTLSQTQSSTSLALDDDADSSRTRSPLLQGDRSHSSSQGGPASQSSRSRGSAGGAEDSAEERGRGMGTGRDHRPPPTAPLPRLNQSPPSSRRGGGAGGGAGGGGAKKVVLL